MVLLRRFLHLLIVTRTHLVLLARPLPQSLRYGHFLGVSVPFLRLLLIFGRGFVPSGILLLGFSAVLITNGSSLLAATSRRILGRLSRNGAELLDENLLVTVHDSTHRFFDHCVLAWRLGRFYVRLDSLHLRVRLGIDLRIRAQLR